MGKRRFRPPLIRRPPQRLVHQHSLPYLIPRPHPQSLPPTPPVLNAGTTASPGLGLEGVLADIRKSLAALVPTAQPGAPPTPLPGVVVPAPPGPPPMRFPEQQAQDQDPSRLALLEVSKLLASINAPAINTPPPTTPWGSSDSWQNTLTDLKHQVDALAAAHASNPLQASVNSLSVARHRAPFSLHPP
ncbi:hypothetical protein NDU88_002621 [Pleurodeles waltl]|uniref:Uncharacterized protein n=1 Tax=Pleurodeles waltl TaxID=8319 RepID=A0AAV7UBQ7_PLEWA|nr:hypothetical protein NDU88_002621 [Pleurodeles waltl]